MAIYRQLEVGSVGQGRVQFYISEVTNKVELGVQLSKYNQAISTQSSL